MTQVSAELKGDTKRQGGRKVQPFRRKVLAEAMAEHVMEESKTFYMRQKDLNFVTYLCRVGVGKEGFWFEEVVCYLLKQAPNPEHTLYHFRQG